MELDLAKTSDIEDASITREFVESRVSEDVLMSTYYGVPVQKGLFKAKHRVDHKATVSYFRDNNGRLLVKDFGSHYCGDWIYVVRNKFGCSYYKALKIAAADFKLISGNVKKSITKIIQPKESVDKPVSSKIQVEIKEFTEKELNWWAQFGISKETLNKYHIFSCKNVFLNDEIFSLNDPNRLIFGYYFGKKDGLEQWKIYYADRKSKVRFITNLKSTALQGGKQIPKDGGDLIVITKSMKDVACLYELGIPAIAPNSENLFVTETQYNKLKEKFKHIVLLYDNDYAGICNMNRIRKNHSDLIVCFIPFKYEAKDISDFRKKYGRKKTLELIEQAKEYYLNGKE